MQYRCLFALLFLPTLLPAQSLRTEADARAAEARLVSNPSDLTARSQLIYFYGRSRPATMTADTVRPLRLPHILWMIENHPDHPSLADSAAVIDKSGTPLADPHAWAEADLAWKRAVVEYPRAETYANAAAFYRIPEPAFALDLAERGLIAFPHNERIATTKGAVLASLMLGIRNLDQFGRATSFDDQLANSREAGLARRELENTTEPAVAAGGAQALSMQQFVFTGQHRDKEAADVVALMERLNKRAVELDPANPRWKSQLARAYWTSASSNRTPAERIALLDKSLAIADESLRLYVMPDLAKAYFDTGNNAKARETATALLDQADRNKTFQNYGGAVHNADIVLGRVALKENNVEEAKSRLLAAGRVPTTPVLGSFGPDWNLARDLLGKGENETVLSYIDLCRQFWTSGKARLDAWTATLRAGGNPNFFGPPEISRTALLGRPAPDFRLKKLGGGEISLADFKGKVVLLDFWATWCAPCRAEMPEFEKLHKELSMKDVAILAVDADEPEDTVADFIKKEKYTLPVVLTDGTGLIKQYSINAYPTTLALDKTGRVADVLVGNSSDAGSRLRAAIDKARNGAPPPPPAPAPVLGGIIGSIPAPAPPPPPPGAPVPPAVTADDFYRDGYRLRAARDLTGALAAFDRALALRKDWLPAIGGRADALFQLRRYDDAIASFTDAIRIDPRRAVSYQQRAQSYANSGRYAAAIPDYTRAIELAPTSYGYYVRGTAHKEVGHMDEALADFNRALELEPAAENALNARSSLFLSRRQYPEVIVDCDAALRINPQSTWPVPRKAEVQRLSGSAPAASLSTPHQLSPAPGTVFDHYPRQTTVVWAGVPGAAAYRVEWSYDSAGSWSEPAPAIATKDPVATFQFVGAQPGRWRVWAVDPAGHEGPKSDWRDFRYTR